MKKVFESQVFEKVLITDAASAGQALARIDNLVVFVEGAVPGDVADIEIYRKKKKLAEAKIIRMHQPSPDRTDPFCEHFGTCGGCKWQHMSYEAQLRFKQKQVLDALQRLAKVELPEILPIIGSEQTTNYRNKLEYTFSNSRWLAKEEMQNGVSSSGKFLGYHISGRFDKVLDIRKCYLQPDPSNQIRDEVKKFSIENDFSFFDLREQTGFLRNLMIRTNSSGEALVLMSFHHDDMNHIKKLLNHLSEKFPEIVSLLYVINPKRNDTIYDLEIKTFKGEDHFFETMEDLRFKISAKSFFQTNTSQAYRLYKITREFAEITSGDLVYDLYTGTGTIANFVAREAKHVVGIDSVPDAIEDAKQNSVNNKISNTSFFSGDMKDMLTTDFISEHGKPSVIITDPPRAGMHEKVVERILEMEADRIVYVSCNPATQARDMILLDQKYRITKVQPVDMFPHTHHVENVLKMERKKF